MSKEKTFEENMDRLQEIVDLLEDGEVTLDNSLKLYEEGLKLAKVLKDQLTNFEKTINEIEKENNEE